MIRSAYSRLAGLWLLTTALIAPALIPTALTAQTSDQDHLQDNVLAQLPWQELGPVLFGGRIVDLAMHPQDRAVFWAASASGGLWHTQNGGISFRPQFQDQYTASIGDIAIAPSAPETLWVGTGECNNQRSSYWGNGVYKSSDGGKSWAHMGLLGTDHIGRIAVHPQNADIVFVAALGALYTPNVDRGLYRTRNGGQTWQCVQHLGADTGFVDVVIDHQNPDVVYAASYERRRRAWDFKEGGQGSRLWKSTDGGDTWQQLAGGLPAGELGRIGIDVFQKDSNVLYVTIENVNATAPPAVTPPSGDDGDAARRDREPSAEELADPMARAAFENDDAAQEPRRRSRRPIVGGEVYRSSDAGQTWQKQNTEPIGGDPGYYYGQIRIDPNDSNVVYVLGVPVFMSKDGGKTWTGTRRDGAPPAFHANLHVDHHALWIDPSDSRHCLLGNDGGLAITWDQGATWDHLGRLPIAQFYTVATDQRTPYRVYGGTQDNGTWGFPIHADTTAGLQASDAFSIDGGDGFCVAIDPFDPDVVYSEIQFGGMTRQHLRSGERKRITPRAEKGQPPLRFNWMTPLGLSPHNAHTLWAGSQFVHRSVNRGDSWTVVSPDLTTNDADKKKGDVPHCTITTIAESPQQAGRLWVGTDDGRVWMTSDEGRRWLELSDRFPEQTRGLWVSRIEASPHAAGTAFVAFTGFREDRRQPLLFRTDDGGETFVAIANDLPDEPINVVRQHPQNAKVLLVGTEMGCHVSIDDGGSWQRLGSGLPRVAVHDLVVHRQQQHVIAATHGRGMWVLDGKALPALDAAIGRAFAALPPSDGVLLRRAFGKGNQGARTWAIESPFTTATFRWLLQHDSDTKVEVAVLDAAGAVLFRQEVEAKSGYHELAWRAPRGQGPGGQGQGGQGGGFGGRGRGTQGQRAGRFAVRLSHGEHKETFAFEVHDRRGPRDALGGVPGAGGADATEDVENHEAAEAATEAEIETPHTGRSGR